MEDGVHSIVLHVGPNTGDLTHKSDLDLGFAQGKILLVLEAFCTVLCTEILGDPYYKGIPPPRINRRSLI